MLIRLYLLLTISITAQAELYRCESQTGEIQFTDQPCATSGSTYEPSAVMTNYKTIQVPKSHDQHATSKKLQACPFISSTELRNLKVKDQFKKGLTQDHIQQRLGKADDILSNKNKSTWIYEGTHVKRTFRFKDACLVGWKEKWKQGQESQISKFRDER
jgi:hypothetical protein